MSERATLDVSHLPDHAFGSRSIMWWSTLCVILIEGTVFVVAVATYFYLQGNETAWPPETTPPPGLFWPTVNTIVLLVSLIPKQLVRKAAETKDIRKLRRWDVTADLFALAFLVIRGFEYANLNVDWDSNAYGSVTWTLLSLHTVHLLTDFIDSVVLTALMFTRHGHEPRRFVDVAENCFYWNFVVLSWLPIYAVLYWSPRWL
jgi:cytochrome c oxidase subunit III